MRSTILSTSVITLLLTTLASAVPVFRAIPDDIKGYFNPATGSLYDQVIPVYLNGDELNIRLDYSANTSFEPMTGGKVFMWMDGEGTENFKCDAFSDREGKKKIGKSFTRMEERKFKKNETVRSIRCRYLKE
jgi:hypothetical protein